jgi:hypothetical protein
MPTSIRQPIFLTLLLALLVGCEQLGIEGPAQEAAARDAEGRAVGSACRHSGRALEDCYTLNPKAVKSAVFTGWRDMDAYMRENNLEIVPSVIPRNDSMAKKKKPAMEEGEPAKGEPSQPKANEPSKGEPAKVEAPPEGKKAGAAPAAPAKAHSALPAGGKMV